jgi:lysine 2,3-aminomutase
MSILPKNDEDPLPSLQFKVTKYYYEKFKDHEEIKKTFMVDKRGDIILPHEKLDHLAEGKQSPTKFIVHRYPNRVLFLVTKQCYLNCQYCTRLRRIENDKFNKSMFEDSFKYIEEHKEIEDVLISGGDPLTYSDKILEYFISKIRKIKHVKIIRIGTKAPVVNPKRVTNSFVKMLKKYFPIYMNIHFTHPDEITKEVSEACKLLSSNGIILGSQTVFLKDINDKSETLKNLFQNLLAIGVKPYIIYQCDQVPGTSYFRTKIEDSLKIMKDLRGFISGLAVPHFIVDLPEGGGKISLTPNYLEKIENEVYLFRNYKNDVFEYVN